MTRRPSRRKSTAPLRFLPGLGYLDKEAHPSVRPDVAFVEARNSRSDSDVLESRPGKRRVSRFTDPSLTDGSWVFGSGGVHAKVAAATQLQIPVGGFALRWSGTAVRPSGGNTAYVVSSRINGEAHHVFQLTLSDAGVFTATWRSESGSTHTAVSGTVTAAAGVHLLVVFDPAAGTFTIYEDGESLGTPATGIASTEKPRDDSGVDWYFGEHFDPATSSVANTEFGGRNDALTLFAFRGASLTEGSRSLLRELRRKTWQQWTNPGSSMVLFMYDCDEASGTSLVDRSRHKNHGLLVGGPTSGAAVVAPAANGNWVGTLQEANGALKNVLELGGALYYETIREGA